MRTYTDLHTPAAPKRASAVTALPKAWDMPAAWHSVTCQKGSATIDTQDKALQLAASGLAGIVLIAAARADRCRRLFFPHVETWLLHFLVPGMRDRRFAGSQHCCHRLHNCRWSASVWTNVGTAHMRPFGARRIRPSCIAMTMQTSIQMHGNNGTKLQIPTVR